MSVRRGAVLLGSALVLTSCLWGTRAAKFSGPRPSARDVASPEGLDLGLAHTRIAWGREVYLDGSEVALPTSFPEGASQADLSPSGRYLVYVTGFVVDDKIEWLDLDTGERRVLAGESDFTPRALALGNPSFTADEQTVVFEVGWSNAIKVAAVDLASGHIDVVDTPGAANTYPRVSPDGRWIVVSCEDGDPGGNWALCLIDREARTRTTLTDDEGYDPLLGGLFTPDGQFVVYFTGDTSLGGDGRVYRIGIDGQDKLLLVSGIYQGDALLATTERETVFSCGYPETPACSWVCVVNLDGTDVRRLTYLGDQCVDVNVP
ncbi:MAG: hypothetical protein AB1449_09875 [Chloroflexota bacterium]